MLTQECLALPYWGHIIMLENPHFETLQVHVDSSTLMVLYNSQQRSMCRYNSKTQKHANGKSSLSPVNTDSYIYIILQMQLECYVSPSAVRYIPERVECG